MDTNNILLDLRTVVSHNQKQISLVDGDVNYAENVISFEFEGMSVYDPFFDTTLRFPVDPIEEYGIENIQNMIDKYNELSPIYIVERNGVEVARTRDNHYTEPVINGETYTLKINVFDYDKEQK